MTYVHDYNEVKAKMNKYWRSYDEFDNRVMFVYMLCLLICDVESDFDGRKSRCTENTYQHWTMTKYLKLKAYVDDS